jgi:hypothetical protein
MKTIKISLLGTPHDYQQGLVPLIIRSLRYRVQWVTPAKCDLQIKGPFSRNSDKDFRWLPRAVRPFASDLESAMRIRLRPRSSLPLTLFHTSENVRHDEVSADFSISFDLAVHTTNHIRFPYWMEMIDWSHEGVTGNQNPRFGRLLDIPTMLRPLGNNFLKRPQAAAIFSSHLREPRASLVKAVESIMQVKGFGPYFDKSLGYHQQGTIKKTEILKEFAFNLCPENGLYPGYYTEKIPEAFVAGCLPLTWTDTNVCTDFNPAAFINLEPMCWQEFEPLKELVDSPCRLNMFADQPLLLKVPSIEPLKEFLSMVIKQALG